MATYYTTINDNFPGTSLNTYWLESYGNGSVSVSGNQCVLSISSGLNQEAGISAYTNGLATDGTPLISFQANTAYIFEASFTANGVYNGVSNEDEYEVYVGIQNLQDTLYTSIGAFAYTTTTYAIGCTSTAEVSGALVTGIPNGTKLWFKLEVASDGICSYYYSENGTTWTNLSFNYTFPSTIGLIPYTSYVSYGTVSNAAATCDVYSFNFQTTTPPTVEFTASVVNGSSPLSVNFTDKSPGTFTAWSWDFGDGGTSTAQNPTHTYTSSGIYNVSLSATDYVGTGSYTINNLINVGPGITGISTISNLQELTF